MPILITTVGCLGNENNLHQCPYLTGEDITNCDHNNDAGVICRMDDGENPFVCSNSDTNQKDMITDYINSFFSDMYICRYWCMHSW